MEIEEFIFLGNLRKRIVCFFYRCFWYSVTKTGPRQQRIHEVISYIKTHKNSILQVHTFCSTVVYYKYTQIYTYEHLIKKTWIDRQSHYITYTIVIQAKKIDVDFRGDSLATNTRIWGRHYSWFLSGPLFSEIPCPLLRDSHHCLVKKVMYHSRATFKEALKQVICFSK